jgi:hypothetical protein
MEAYQIFRIWQSFRLHFTSSKYSVLTYGFKTKAVSFETYKKRTDHGIFESWTKDAHSKETWGKICIANFSNNNEKWLYDSKADVMEVYYRWEKVRSSFTEVFRNDYSILAEHAKNQSIGDWREFTKKTPKGNNPIILQLLLANKIHPETVCHLDRLFPFIDDWGVLFDNDPFLCLYILSLKKYTPFCITFMSREKSIMVMGSIDV